MKAIIIFVLIFAILYISFLYVNIIDTDINKILSYILTNKISKLQTPKEVLQIYNPTNETIRMYQTQSVSRKKFLNNTKIGWLDFYSILVPEVLCQDVLRVGTVLDGGKWVCNPIKIRNFIGNCSIYSLGISNEPSFDEALQEFTQKKCMLRAIEKENQLNTTKERIAKINGVLKKAMITKITNKAFNQYSLLDILIEFGDKRIEILKIDIEGTEYQISDQILSVPICQILIEIHGNTARKTLDLLQLFAKKGFYLFSFQINGAYHSLAEYGLIHESCFKSYGVEIIYGRYLA